MGRDLRIFSEHVIGIVITLIAVDFEISFVFFSCLKSYCSFFTEWVTPAQHIKFSHAHFPGKSLPNHQNGVPKMNFPEFPGPGFSVEISLNFPWFPGISRPPRFQHFGVPIFSVLGSGNEVDMLGIAEDWVSWGNSAVNLGDPRITKLDSQKQQTHPELQGRLYHSSKDHYTHNFIVGELILLLHTSVTQL